MRREVVVVLVVGVLIALGGGGWVAVNHKSATALAQQSASYQPTCDGKTMHPGDTCMSYDNHGGSSSSYEDLVAAHSPQSLGRQYAGRQRVGWYIVLAGLLLALLAGVNLAVDARTARRRTASA